jgi:hypothetical protein
MRANFLPHFLNHLQDLRLNHEESQWLDSNIVQLQDEVFHHQQAQILVNDRVREQTQASLSLKDEIQRLEEQNLEDRVRVQRLLSLRQPVGEDVTILLPAVSPSRGGAGGDGQKDEEERERGAGPAMAKDRGAGKPKVRRRGRPDGIREVFEDEREDESDPLRVGGGPDVRSSEEAYKQRQAKWVARALLSEKDAGVAYRLEGVQAANHEIARSKASYEGEVLELQRRRVLREAEAAQVLTPALKTGEEAVGRGEEQEGAIAKHVQACLQLLVETQGEKAKILKEQTRLARARKQLAMRVRTYQARLGKVSKAVMEEERGRVAVEMEGEKDALREELVAVEEEIAGMKKSFEEARPRMEQKLRGVEAAAARRREGLRREKRRYRWDKEGYENDVRQLMTAVTKAKKLEEQLRMERAAVAAVTGEGEGNEEGVSQEGKEGEGVVEGGNVEELNDLMFQLELLLSKNEEEEN